MLEVSGMSFRKGRKFGRERVIGNFGCPAVSPAGGGDGELAEDDVWSTIDDTAAFKGETKRMSAATRGGPSGRARRWPIACSGGHGQVGGLSLAFEDAAGGVGGNPATAAMIIQQYRPAEDPPAGTACHSAPVNVPDWSKILLESSEDSPPQYDVACSTVDEDREWVPPHEYLARESARRRCSATSVFEGVGRTLKGRDMSRVRNAVWRQTGFFG